MYGAGRPLATSDVVTIASSVCAEPSQTVHPRALEQGGRDVVREARVQWRGAGHRLRVALVGTVRGGSVRGGTGRGGSGRTVAVDLEPFAAVPMVGDAVVLGVMQGEAVIVPRDDTIGGLRVPAVPVRSAAG